MAGEMKYIDIPRLERPVARLIMGSMMLSDDRMEHAEKLLDAYTAIGGNAIDTAPVYGVHGMRAIGNWMRERGNRSQFTLIGKAAHPDHQGPRMTRQAIQQDLAFSMEAMGTDDLDLLLLHRDDPGKSAAEIIDLLQEPLTSGQCRAIGTSNWTAERIEEANRYAADHGLIGFSCNSPNLSLAKPNEPRWAGCVSVDDAFAAWHEGTGMPLLSWSSQAGGFFTGRFSPDKRDDREAVRVYYSDPNWERYRRTRELAERKGCDANQIALAFVLHQPFPVCAIIGPNSGDELQSSAQALDVRLTPEELLWLDLKTE